jgi:hypothetical protein
MPPVASSYTTQDQSPYISASASDVNEVTRLRAELVQLRGKLPHFNVSSSDQEACDLIKYLYCCIAELANRRRSS